MDNHFYWMYTTVRTSQNSKTVNHTTTSEELLLYLQFLTLALKSPIYIKLLDLEIICLVMFNSKVLGTWYNNFLGAFSSQHIKCSVLITFSKEFETSFQRIMMPTPVIWTSFPTLLFINCSFERDYLL